MFDPNAPSSQLALAELQKEKVRKNLLTYAVWRTKIEADAEDLVGDAIERVCDPDRKPWDPTKGSFFRHMRLVMDRIAIEQARVGYRHFEKPDIEVTLGERAVDEQPAVDDAVHAQRKLAWLRQLGNILVAKLRESDPFALKVFEAASDGEEEPHEQAKRIGCRVEEVYEAWRRLKYHGAKIRAQWEIEEAERMKLVRASAKKEEVR